MGEQGIHARVIGAAPDVAALAPAADETGMAQDIEMIGQRRPGPGLAQLGVAAVRLGWVFLEAWPLRRVIELCHLLWEASRPNGPAFWNWPDVLAAFGAEFHLEFPGKEAGRAKASPPRPRRPRSPGCSERAAETVPSPGRIWLEARDYAEAAFLTRDWREPLIFNLIRRITPPF